MKRRYGIGTNILLYGTHDWIFFRSEMCDFMFSNIEMEGVFGVDDSVFLPNLVQSLFNTQEYSDFIFIQKFSNYNGYSVKWINSRVRIRRTEENLISE